MKRIPKATNRVFFEVPFVIDSPNFEKPDLGLGRMMLRGGTDSFLMESTLIDTPDSRLIRSGVVLAKRFINGEGQWYLSSQDWGAWLPNKFSLPLEDDDIPKQMTNLVSPFRRQASLAPVAEIKRDRKEYLIRGVAGQGLGRLRDDKVTIRRGGAVAKRYREVTIYPDPEMTPEQLSYITATLESTGGLRVDRFEKFVNRLGAPYSGGTDIPDPAQIDDSMLLKDFVSAVLSHRLRELIRADLAVRSGSVNDISGVMLQLRGLREDVAAFAGFFDPGWRTGLEAMIDAVLDLGAHTKNIESLGDSYFAVLDVLVSATQAPRLNEDAKSVAKKVLGYQIKRMLSQVNERCSALLAQSLDRTWVLVVELVEQCLALVLVSNPLMGGDYRKLAKRLRKILQALQPTIAIENEPLAEDIAHLTPVEAYNLGRSIQAKKDEVRLARLDFVDHWNTHSAKLSSIDLKF